MWIAIAACNLALAVMFGAFGAHALKARLLPEQLAWWHTSTEYFFYHALGLLALGILHKVWPQLPVKTSFVMMQLGIVLFCASLYAMSFGLPRSLGMITPIGGMLLIAAWLSLAYQAYQHRIS